MCPHPSTPIFPLTSLSHILLLRPHSCLFVSGKFLTQCRVRRQHVQSFSHTCTVMLSYLTVHRYSPLGQLHFDVGMPLLIKSILFPAFSKFPQTCCHYFVLFCLCVRLLRFLFVCFLGGGGWVGTVEISITISPHSSIHLFSSSYSPPTNSPSYKSSSNKLIPLSLTLSPCSHPLTALPLPHYPPTNSSTYLS